VSASCGTFAGSNNRVEAQIGDAIDLALHLERRKGARVVQELIMVGHYDADSDRFATTQLHSSREDSELRSVRTDE